MKSLQSLLTIAFASVASLMGATAPMPLTVTPANTGISNGDKITITFDQPVSWVYQKDGSSNSIQFVPTDKDKFDPANVWEYNGAELQSDGKVMVVTFNDYGQTIPILLETTWTLVFPKGQVENGAGEQNEEFCIAYGQVDYDVAVTGVAPVKGPVASGSPITLSFDKDIDINYADAASILTISGPATDDTSEIKAQSVPASEITVSGKELSFTPTLTEIAGVYTVTLSKGALMAADNAFSQTDAYSFDFELEGPWAISSYSPTETQQKAPFKSITLTLPKENVEYDETFPITLQDTDGNCAELFVAISGMEAQLSFNVIYDGNYTLTVPAGAFKAPDTSRNQELTVDYEVVQGEKRPISPISIAPEETSQKAPFEAITIEFSASQGDVTINESKISFVEESTGKDVDFQATADGNIVTISMSLTRNGKYTLTCSSGAFANDSGESEAFERSWTVNDGEEPGYVPTSCTPEEGEVEAPFTNITIYFDYAVSINEDKGKIRLIYDKTGDLVELSMQAEENSLVLDFEATDEGSYSLYIPAGKLNVGDEFNQAVSLTWTVVEASVAAIEPESFTPEAGYVTTPFSNVTMTFAEDGGDVAADAGKIAMNGPEGAEIPLTVSTEANTVVITFDAAQLGCYTLQCAEGAITNSLGSSAVIERSWQLVSDGIGHVDADISGVRYFDLEGRPVMNPEPGQVVVKINSNNGKKIVLVR